MDDRIARRKAFASLALGPSIMAMGVTTGVMATASHNIVVKLLDGGASIFIITIGLILMVRGIAKVKKTKAGLEERR